MIQSSSTCSPCWSQEASSGAACPRHSSLREVALLSLGEVQEYRANTNGYRSWSGVFSWQGMHWAGKHYCSECSLWWDYSVSIPMHVLSKPFFGYLQLYFLLYTKRANMHGQDTLSLHDKHCSAMNDQNRNCVLRTALLIFSNKEVEKNDTR